MIKKKIPRGMKKYTLMHYNRMIKWAESQDPIDPVDCDEMIEAIDEGWGSSNCPYCKQYWEENDSCPLTNVDICVGMYCCNGLWNEMNKAEDWKEWIKCAKKVKAFIKATPINKK